MRAKDSRGLLLYMWTVTALAIPLLVVTAEQAWAHGWATLAGRGGLAVALFCLVLVLGEMWPIPVARGQEAGDEITVSSTFGFALLLVAPVFVPIIAQAVALGLDWRLRGRAWHRLPFNIAQYVLAFGAARGVYAWTAGEAFTPPPGLVTPQLGPAAVAAATFLLLNNTLVGVAIASTLQVRLGRVLRDDLSWQITTSAPLLGLGPLAAHAASWTPVSVVLLLLPIVALHRSGSVAMRREQEALRDGLTGLANRTMLAAAAERALQSGSGSTAMLLLDLDHFKDINDTLGHAVGDRLLVSVAERLRAEAGPGDLVARLGGDEFVVLARGTGSRDSAHELADRLGSAVRQPFHVQGVTLTVGCSIGIGIGPEHADTVEGLLRCADVALYTAKVTRGTFAVYDKHGDRHSVALLGLQADLRAALEDEADQQLWVAYQPQYDLHAGTVSSVECLVRWRHPELGDLTPDTFIPIAENTSLTDLLLRRVLLQSLAQLAEWDRCGLRLTASVNLSARQLSDLSLPATVAELLARFGLGADRLVLEVTESRLMSDPERSAAILSELHAMGVGVSVDDFGTGYSSLAYLQRLAVDEIKIDKSFTIGLHEPGNATIVRSTIELGHNLGLRVVAEGVEDREAAAQLAGMGCDLLQGYFIGRPVAAAALPPSLLGVSGAVCDMAPRPPRVPAPDPRRPQLSLVVGAAPAPVLPLLPTQDVLECS